MSFVAILSHLRVVQWYHVPVVFKQLLPGTEDCSVALGVKASDMFPHGLRLAQEVMPTMSR